MPKNGQEPVEVKEQVKHESTGTESAAASEGTQNQRTFTTERFERPPLVDSEEEAQPDKRSKKGLYAIIIVAAIVIVVSGIAVFVLSGASGSAAPSQPSGQSDSPTSLSGSHLS